MALCGAVLWPRNNRNSMGICGSSLASIPRKFSRRNMKSTSMLLTPIPDDQQFVSVNGRAQLIRDRAKIEQLWNPIYKAWFPNGLDDPELALIKVNVEGAEYWDTPNGKMVQLIGFVKSIATGKPYGASQDEHDKIK